LNNIIFVRITTKPEIPKIKNQKYNIHIKIKAKDGEDRGTEVGHPAGQFRIVGAGRVREVLNRVFKCLAL